LPDEYGLLKPYVVTDDHVLELADAAADAIEHPGESAGQSTREIDGSEGGA
jgi:hypothetical protein